MAGAGAGAKGNGTGIRAERWVLRPPLPTTSLKQIIESEGGQQ